MYVRKSTYIYIHVYTYTYMCIHIHTCVYISTHPPLKKKTLYRAALTLCNRALLYHIEYAECRNIAIAAKNSGGKHMYIYIHT
jgi:hypothetical protein